MTYWLPGFSHACDVGLWHAYVLVFIYWDDNEDKIIPLLLIPSKLTKLVSNYMRRLILQLLACAHQLPECTDLKLYT